MNTNGINIQKDDYCGYRAHSALISQGRSELICSFQEDNNITKMLALL